MKAQPFLTAGKAILLVCFSLFVVLPLVVGLYSSVQNWSYTRFCWRGQKYYARVAEACDQILSAHEPMPRELRRDSLKSLPPILRELSVDHVIVNTNLVMMVVGSGLTSGHIVWRQTEYGSRWELITSNPEAHNSRVRYTELR